MTEDKKLQEKQAKKDNSTQENKKTKSVFAQKKKVIRKIRRSPVSRGEQDEFEQRIIDIARVTRVMAGGKRLSFRACVALGNRKGKVGIGLGKGADVTIAITKAVNKAKKSLIDVPIVNDTIPHEIETKFGAAKILLKPARRGRGVIAGGAARIILELSGIKNITSKNLGTNNKINVSKCVIKALDSLKKVVNVKKEETEENKEINKSNKKDNKNKK